MNSLTDHQDELMLYSLALLAIITGLTKFTNPELWLGEHGLGHISYPWSSQTVLLIGGLIETATGMALLTRRRSDIVAFLIGTWILAITVAVAINGLWLIVVRDFFLAIFAFLVSINEYGLKQN